MVLNYFQVRSAPPPGAPGPNPPLGAPSNDNNIHTMLGINARSGQWRNRSRGLIGSRCPWPSKSRRWLASTWSCWTPRLHRTCLWSSPWSSTCPPRTSSTNCRSTTRSTRTWPRPLFRVSPWLQTRHRRGHRGGGLSGGEECFWHTITNMIFLISKYFELCKTKSVFTWKFLPIIQGLTHSDVSLGAAVWKVRQSVRANPTDGRHHEYRLQERAVCRLRHLLPPQTVQHQGQVQQEHADALPRRDHREKSSSIVDFLCKLYCIF